MKSMTPDQLTDVIRECDGKREEAERYKGHAVDEVPPQKLGEAAEYEGAEAHPRDEEREREDGYFGTYVEFLFDLRECGG
jgi:hypothetical protein